MVLYQFQCLNCEADYEEIFPASEYDKRITEDGRLKRKKCKKCGTLSLYRHIIKAPQVMGGTSGYVSMERWQKMNPDHTKRKEEDLQKRLGDRHRKRVLDKINKQVGGNKRNERYEGYGDGQGETKLGSID